MKNVLVRPVITEKSMKDAQNNRFSFIVGNFASKEDIKKTVEKLYGVNVLDIATSIIKGKMKRVGKKRTEKMLESYKKAIVRVKDGQKIALFDT